MSNFVTLQKSQLQKNIPKLKSQSVFIFASKALDVTFILAQTLTCLMVPMVAICALDPIYSPADVLKTS